MIIGVGMDLVELSRVRALLTERAGARFQERLLTKPEQELAKARPRKLVEFVAGRFAAKEAIVKAFGCGIGGVIGLQDMTVVPDKQGKPCCQLTADAWARLGLNEQEIRIHLSITHTETLAGAYVVVERVVD